MKTDLTHVQSKYMDNGEAKYSIFKPLLVLTLEEVCNHVNCWVTRFTKNSELVRDNGSSPYQNLELYYVIMVVFLDTVYLILPSLIKKRPYHF